MPRIAKNEKEHVEKNDGAFLYRILELLRYGLSPEKNTIRFCESSARSFNNEVLVEVELPDRFAMKGTVDGEVLLSILPKLKNSDLEINISENVMRIKSGKRKEVGIPLKDEGKENLDFIPKKMKWNALEDEFSEAVQTVSSNCAKNMAIAALSFMYWTEKAVYGCNQFAAVRYRIAGGPKDAVLLPVNSAEVLASLIPTGYGISEGWIHFKDDQAGRTVSFRTAPAESYPDVFKIFKVEGRCFQFPASISAALDRAGIFSTDELKDDPTVSVELKKDVLKISGNCSSGWYEERIKVTGNELSASFLIDPAMLQKALLFNSEVTVGQTSVLIKNDAIKYVVALR